MSTFVHRSVMPASPDEVFAFHERPEAFRLLTPWWSGAQVVVAAPHLRPGARAVLRLGPPLLRRTWVVEHTVYDPPHEFVDRQVCGPFQSWEHHHRILPHARGALLIDEVTYAVPSGLLGRVAAVVLVRPYLGLLFAHRHHVTRQYLASRRGRVGR
jgi:ligand-binding SRPBCC domain-containing protein